MAFSKNEVVDLDGDSELREVLVFKHLGFKMKADHSKPVAENPKRGFLLQTSSASSPSAPVVHFAVSSHLQKFLKSSEQQVGHEYMAMPVESVARPLRDPTARALFQEPVETPDPSPCDNPKLEYQFFKDTPSKPESYGETVWDARDASDVKDTFLDSEDEQMVSEKIVHEKMVDEKMVDVELILDDIQNLPPEARPVCYSNDGRKISFVGEPRLNHDSKVIKSDEPKTKPKLNLNSGPEVIKSDEPKLNHDSKVNEFQESFEPAGAFRHEDFLGLEKPKADKEKLDSEEPKKLDSEEPKESSHNLVSKALYQKNLCMFI